MPSSKPTINGRTVKFDARPDRIDYRDRTYRAPLVSLPEVFPSPEFLKRWLPDYTANGLVLDQGEEGACTGFGLAAVINYLLWYRQLQSDKAVELPGNKHLLIQPSVVWDTERAEDLDIEPVSPHMLYHMARIYDEWPGEQYEGSSCRGAMKGWYRHGVCRRKFWKKSLAAEAEKSKKKSKSKKGLYTAPESGWQNDAARYPLGAYYRIGKDSLNDLRAAIHEVGAIYTSATVHAGWFLDECETMPIISTDNLDETGGHAFALVGYTPDGFIVQNSWGPKWGFQGFAVLTYRDWLLNGADAWVAVLGAPTRIPKDFPASRTVTDLSLGDVVSGKGCGSWQSQTQGVRTAVASDGLSQLRGVDIWSTTDAYLHSVVLGNEGEPLNRTIDRASPAAAVEEIVLDRPSAFFAANSKSPRLVIYAHGGLNSEADSVKRIRRMAPYFEANGIYPVYLTWQTGFVESIQHMLGDAVRQTVFGGPAEAGTFGSILDDIQQRLADTRDRTLEVATRNLLVRPVWTQMKQNAAAGALGNSGLVQIASHLKKLSDRISGLEIHLVGHSAGSIILGHLLKLLTTGRRAVSIASIELYAAACTVAFANEHYGKWLGSQPDARRNFFCRVMSDFREREDSIGPYGKSLLYLVSRALEDFHKMPLLGMEGTWQDIHGRDDLWNKAGRPAVERWRDIVANDKDAMLTIHHEASVNDGTKSIPLAHGSFDNDIAVVSATIRRICGLKKPSVPVTDLSEF